MVCQFINKVFSKSIGICYVYGTVNFNRLLMAGGTNFERGSSSRTEAVMRFLSFV